MLQHEKLLTAAQAQRCDEMWFVVSTENCCAAELLFFASSRSFLANFAVKCFLLEAKRL